MRFLKFAGAVAVAALSASVLALSGLGAAVASADPGHHHPDIELIDVHDVYVHHLVNVFAPITVFDVLNNVDILTD